jgi:hypothetical protein
MKSPRLHDLRTQSDWIGIVEITSGRILRSEGTHCGAAYTGRVVELSKGSQAQGSIRFGAEPGLKIGAQHVVFLKKPPLDEDPIWPDSVQIVQRGVEYSAEVARAACTRVWPGYRSLLRVAAGMEVHTYPELIGGKSRYLYRWVAVVPFAVGLPDDLHLRWAHKLKRLEPGTSEHQWASHSPEPVWLERRQLMDYLRGN